MAINRPRFLAILRRSGGTVLSSMNDGLKSCTRQAPHLYQRKKRSLSRTPFPFLFQNSLKFSPRAMAQLTLTPLRRLAGLLETELSAFFGTSITLQITELLDLTAQLDIVFEQSTSNTVADSF